MTKLFWIFRKTVVCAPAQSLNTLARMMPHHLFPTQSLCKFYSKIIKIRHKIAYTPKRARKHTQRYPMQMALWALL